MVILFNYLVQMLTLNILPYVFLYCGVLLFSLGYCNLFSILDYTLSLPYLYNLYLRPLLRQCTLTLFVLILKGWLYFLYSLDILLLSSMSNNNNFTFMLLILVVNWLLTIQDLLFSILSITIHSIYYIFGRFFIISLKVLDILYSLHFTLKNIYIFLITPD